MVIEKRKGEESVEEGKGPGGGVREGGERSEAYEQRWFHFVYLVTVLRVKRPCRCIAPKKVIIHKKRYGRSYAGPMLW